VLGLDAQLQATGKHSMLGNDTTIVPDHPLTTFAGDLHRHAYSLDRQLKLRPGTKSRLLYFTPLSPLPLG
jgi:hypothetical protein